MKTITINNIRDFDKISTGTLLAIERTINTASRPDAPLFLGNDILLLLLLKIVNNYNSDVDTGYYFDRKDPETAYLVFLGMTSKGIFFLYGKDILKFRINASGLLNFPFDIKHA